MTGDGPIRLQARCRGTVQGVGFRPTVHRVATRLGLAGWVINDPLGATLEVEGPAEVVERFVDELVAELPPLARLDQVEQERREPLGETSFEVRSSTTGRRAGALVPPDAVLCSDCLRDMEDAADRRYRYPFTTCTNCGPRFSLVHALPYDRERTSMACFAFCPDCEREYTDPLNRRFHAEPVACPACGPRLWLADAEGREMESADPLATARWQLKAGHIVAVKGLGGFHLACRADSEAAVSRLRERKRRLGKPFAVMVRDTESAAELVELDAAALALMRSPRSPIVLAPRRRPSVIADGVAPGLSDLGVMIPTTPLHVELFRDPELPPLVMTSGNLSEEPLCRGNREAVDRLNGIADIFVLHDRDIVRRVDDSVVRTSEGEPVVVRRARGWVPEPLPLPEPSDAAMVAVGGHLQVTACVTDGQQAFPSQHVGDLDSTSAREFLREVIEGLLEFLQVTPGMIVADGHPDYPSTWLASELAETHEAEMLTVQHHLAHVAAVLGEHGRFPDRGESILGVALDGTGWGPDGTAWGGEWLELDGNLRWRRVAHLEPLSLVGGETAVREPWRVAVAALQAHGDLELAYETPMAGLVADDRLRAVADLAASPSWPLASGAGRIFEAAGAILGLTAANRWEGEAAALLEAAASAASHPADPWAEIDLENGPDGPVLPSGKLLVMAARRIAGGVGRDQVAAEFHAAFSRLVVEVTHQLAGGSAATVACGGGCLVNRIVRSELVTGFRSAGLELLLPVNLPPGDGGLCFGQAVIGNIASARRVRPVVAGGTR